MLELRAIPEAPITYTTDGSDPKLAGASYEGPFVVRPGTTLVLVYAERDGVASQIERIVVPATGDKGTVPVDTRRPAIWTRSFELQSTKETYECIERARKHNATFVGIKLTIMGEGGDNEWIELNTFQDKRVTPELVEEVLTALRKLQGSGQVQLAAEALSFPLGQELLDWVEEVKATLEPGEVKQS